MIKKVKNEVVSYCYQGKEIDLINEEKVLDWL